MLVYVWGEKVFLVTLDILAIDLPFPEFATITVNESQQIYSASLLQLERTWGEGGSPCHHLLQRMAAESKTPEWSHYHPIARSSGT